MWQSSKAYPLAYCPPGSICGRALVRGRCPRLLMVVPSRHQSACGIPSVVGYYPEDGRFILVYRLAMDAKTRKGDGVAG